MAPVAAPVVIPAHVVIPVKAFHAAKGRLASVLDPAARADLARSMAEAVVAASAPLPVMVVCDDRAVADWARALGVDVAWTPGLGLDGAVEEGVRVAEGAGAARVVVAHADLPLARDLAGLVGPDGPDAAAVTLVPDRHEDGTNVVVLPAACGFRFAYGPGSFARHRAEAVRCGREVHVVRDAHLGWDVDHPADLDLPSEAELARAASACGPGASR